MLKVKLLNENATIPTRGSEHAAGYDLYASEDFAIEEGVITTVKTDIALAIPSGFVGLVKPRSGLSFKHGIDTMAGVIDSDYRGEVKVLLTSHDNCEYIEFQKGDRIAQLVIVPCLTPAIVAVDDLDETNRGDGGFGSTGA